MKLTDAQIKSLQEGWLDRVPVSMPFITPGFAGIVKEMFEGANVNQEFIIEQVNQETED